MMTRVLGLLALLVGVWLMSRQCQGEGVPVRSTVEPLPTPVYTVSAAIKDYATLHGKTIAIIGTIHKPSFVGFAGSYWLVDNTSGQALRVWCDTPPLPAGTTVKVEVYYRVVQSDENNLRIILRQRSCEPYDESAQFYQPL